MIHFELERPPNDLKTKLSVIGSCYVRIWITNKLRRQSLKEKLLEIYKKK